MRRKLMPSSWQTLGKCRHFGCHLAGIIKCLVARVDANLMPATVDLTQQGTQGWMADVVVAIMTDG